MEARMLWTLGGWGLFVVFAMLLIRKLMNGKMMGGDLPTEPEDPKDRAP